MAWLLTCLFALGLQSPADVPTVAVSGVAVDGSTNRPLPGALIFLVGERAGVRVVQWRQVTDAKGRFVFANLAAADQFRLTGSKSGYLDGFNAPESAPRGTSTPIRVAAGDWFSSARVALYPPGAIGGRVLDETGAPIVGTAVRLLSRVKIQGRSEFAAGPTVRTDDRGAFRFSGLPPGSYVAMVPSVLTSVPSDLVNDNSRSGGDAAALEMNGARLLIDRYVIPPPPLNGRVFAYPPTFYPGTTSAAEATAIALGYAESRNDIDLRLRPIETRRVSGTVAGSKDAMVNLTLRLLPAGLENLGIGSEVATALVDGDGRFTFFAVPDGTYLLDGPRTMTELNMAGTSSFDQPQPPAPPGSNGSSSNIDAVPMLPGIDVSTRTQRSNDTPNFWVRMPLSVSADVENVVVPMRPMGSISGTVRFESDPAQSVTRPRFQSITLDPASGSPGLGIPRSGTAPDSGDEFWIPGLAPAPYFLRFNAAGGWMVKSIAWSGRDYTFASFDALTSASINGVSVVVTNSVPTLGGTVTGVDGAVKAGATVIVFPADRGQWFNFGLRPVQFATMVAGTDGAYQTRSLPAGEYFVVSIAAPIDDWLRPEFLEIAAKSATRVTLSWGKASTTDLHVAEIKR